MSGDTFISIWERLASRFARKLSSNPAQAMQQMRFQRREIARMNQLAVKARVGKLSDRERAELDDYIRVGNMLTVWHAHAEMRANRSKVG